MLVYTPLHLTHAPDVRYFPLAFNLLHQRLGLEEEIEQAFRLMSNIQHLVWSVSPKPTFHRADTQRDKSLTPRIVETLTSLPNLRTLEISGRSIDHYDPRVLGTLPQLESLRIYMPDNGYRETLLPLLEELHQRPQGGLRGLEIIASVSIVVF